MVDEGQYVARTLSISFVLLQRLGSIERFGDAKIVCLEDGYILLVCVQVLDELADRSALDVMRPVRGASV